MTPEETRLKDKILKLEIQNIQLMTELKILRQRLDDFKQFSKASTTGATPSSRKDGSDSYGVY